MTDILTELDRWWPVLGILATLVYGWGVYHLSRRFATKYEHDGLAGCVSGLAGRVDDLERRMETVPDGQDHARHTIAPQRAAGRHESS